MKLTNEQIKSIAFGAVRIEEKENGLVFFKTTQKQVDAWTAHSETLGLRAQCPTGVRLDFETDSDFFEAKFKNAHRAEILVNGFYAGVIDNGVIHKELPGGTNRVTLVFPSHDSVPTLESVSLSDNASFTPHIYDRKILLIGDSITQGWNSGIDCTSYAWRTMLSLNADCVINGIGGAYYAPDTFDSIDFVPETVTVAYGTNDYGHYKTKTEFETAVKEHLSLLKNEYQYARCVCILPPPRFDLDKKRSMGTFDECRDIIRKCALETGFETVDAYDFVPSDMQFFADALHPNALGFSYYAENLVKILGEK